MLLSEGIFLGLSAALVFGLSDFLSALLSRQFGTLCTLIGVQVVGVILFSVYFLRTGEAVYLQVSSLPMVLLVGGGLALLDCFAYFCFYTGLRIGPIAIVSPITASCSSVTVLLAIGMGELPTFWQGVGICAVLVGVILMSLDFSVLQRVWFALISPDHHKILFVERGHRAVPFKREEFSLSAFSDRFKAMASAVWHRVTFRKSGSFFAGIAMICFGFHLFFLSRWTQVVGPVTAIFFIRVFSTLILGAVAVFFRRDMLSRTLPFKGVAAITLLGILDTAGLLAYSAGTMKALTSIVTTLESSYLLIPTFLGVLIFRERLARMQGAGIVAILLGLGLITGLHV